MGQKQLPELLRLLEVSNGKMREVGIGKTAWLVEGGENGKEI